MTVPVLNMGRCVDRFSDVYVAINGLMTGNRDWALRAGWVEMQEQIQALEKLAEDNAHALEDADDERAMSAETEAELRAEVERLQRLLDERESPTAVPPTVIVDIEDDEA